MSRPDAVIPPDIDEPVFAEPWQAQAFALVVALTERGVFTREEWAKTLSIELHRPDAAPDGGDYYQRWLRALETLVASRQLAAAAEVDELADAWRRAAQATPHGKPILLENDPLSRDRQGGGRAGDAARPQG